MVTPAFTVLVEIICVPSTHEASRQLAPALGSDRGGLREWGILLLVLPELVAKAPDQEQKASAGSEGFYLSAELGQ